MSDGDIYIIKSNIDERSDFLDPNPEIRYFGINIVFGIEGNLDERNLRSCMDNLSEEAIATFKREYGILDVREPE